MTKEIIYKGYMNTKIIQEIIDELKNLINKNKRDNSQSQHIHEREKEREREEIKWIERFLFFEDHDELNIDIPTTTKEIWKKMKSGKFAEHRTHGEMLKIFNEENLSLVIDFFK